MVRKKIYVSEGDKKKTYFYHETYDEFSEALAIAKYYKAKEKSKYYILKDTWSKRKIQYHLYLDNIWNAI